MLIKKASWFASLSSFPILCPPLAWPFVSCLLRHRLVLTSLWGVLLGSRRPVDSDGIRYGLSCNACSSRRLGDYDRMPVCVTLALWTDTLVIQQGTGGDAHGACAAYVSRLSGALSASQQQFQQLSMPGHTSIERQVWFIL